MKASTILPKNASFNDHLGLAWLIFNGDVCQQADQTNLKNILTTSRAFGTVYITKEMYVRYSRIGPWKNKWRLSSKSADGRPLALTDDHDLMVKILSGIEQMHPRPLPCLW